MEDIAIQNQALNLIKDKQQQLKLSDADLVRDIMSYQKWWRVKTKQQMLTHVEVVKLMKRVGFDTYYIKPREVFNAVVA